MNKERLQAIIDRIEADANRWRTSRSLFSVGIAKLAQIDSWCQPNIFNARRDARIWLDLSSKQADYLFSSFRTLKEIKAFAKQHGDDDYDRKGFDRHGLDRGGYDCDGYTRAGYDREGYDRAGFNEDGYDFDGLDKHNKPKSEQV